MKNFSIRRFIDFSIVKTLVLAAVSFGLALDAQAGGGPSISYIDDDGTVQTTSEYTTVDDSATGVSWASGTYIVGKDYNGDGKIDGDDAKLDGVQTVFAIGDMTSVDGDVKLILADGFTLDLLGKTTSWDARHPALKINSGKGLALYGQEGQTGKLVGNATTTYYSIATMDVEGFLVMNGGQLNMTGMSSNGGMYGTDAVEIHDGGSLTVNNGVLTLTGGPGRGNGGAGISVRDGSFTQNGGTVNLTGGADYYGFSSCESSIALNGGTLNVSGTGANAFDLYEVTLTVDPRMEILGDNTNPPTTLLANDANLMDKLASAQYVVLSQRTPIVFSVKAHERATAAVYTYAVDAANLVTGDTVWSNKTAYVVYTADEDYSFEDGRAAITNMLDTTTSPVVDTVRVPKTMLTWADEREVAVDTRERVVIGDPGEVLPIAYSTNNWGEAEGGESVLINAEYEPESSDFRNVVSAKVNGYAEWQPRSGIYGAYRIRKIVVENVVPLDEKESVVYYGAPHTLTITDPVEGGTIAVTTNGAAVASGASILGYTLLGLTATPAANWQLEAWSVTTNGVDCGGIIDAALPETQLEMPNADAVLTASFIVSDDYVNEATNALTATYNDDVAYLESILTGDDLVAAKTDLMMAYDNGIAAIQSARTPSAVTEALAAAQQAQQTLTDAHSKFAVTYDANGGAWADGAETTNIDAFVKTGYELPAADPMRNGYSFTGWYTNATCAGEAVASGDALAKMAEHTLYAGWANAFTFEETQYAVTEGGAVTVRIFGGNAEAKSQVTLTAKAGTGTYTAAYYKGKKVTLPLTFGFDQGEVSVREIVFRTAASSEKYDRTFTLQLGSPVAQDTCAGHDICTVTIGKAGGATATRDYVRVLAYPANGGTVSGGGVLKSGKTVAISAKAKNGSKFAGWYRAMPGDENLINLADGIGTVASRKIKTAGTYYAYFTNVLEVARAGVPDVTAASARGVVTDDNMTFTGMVGVKFVLPCACTGGSMTVTSRPDGLKWNAARGILTGVPTKAGTYWTRFAAKNAAGTHVVHYTIVIKALPTAARGTWTGVVRDEADAAGLGAVTFTAGAKGKLSAKVTTCNAGTQTFTANCYTRVDENTLGVSLSNKAGVTLTANLDLTADWGEAQLKGVYDVLGSKYAKYDEGGTIALLRNPYDASTGTVSARQLLAAYIGTYSDGVYNAAGTKKGTASFKVKDTGNVIVAGTYGSKKFSGTVAGGLKVGSDGTGTVETALRSGKRIWSADAALDGDTRAVEGEARYIAGTATDVKTLTVGPQRQPE